MLLYLKCDVHQTADVVQYMRKMIYEMARLDMSHHVSIPHCSWDMMLKLTGIQIPLITDHAMFELIHRGIRGGVAMISSRYARANNPALGPHFYDPTKPITWIVYWDANNLYGWAMSQALPLGDFRWLTGEEMRAVDWEHWNPETSDTGYIFELDLFYPSELHNDHNDYPLAPERIRIMSRQCSVAEQSAEAVVAEQERRMHVEDELGHNIICEELVNERLNATLEAYGLPPSGNNTKLTPHLGWRRRYVVHGAMLKFLLDHGLKAYNIRSVISFRQARWLAHYVDECARRRKAASNEFEQDLFKLLPNSAYGVHLRHLFNFHLDDA
jgi:hypothetical protein